MKKKLLKGLNTARSYPICFKKVDLFSPIESGLKELKAKEMIRGMKVVKLEM
jgi:hypothetical protein